MDQTMKPAAAMEKDTEEGEEDDDDEGPYKEGTDSDG